MDKFEIMETEIEDLKKQLWDVCENVIKPLKEQVSGEGGTTTSPQPITPTTPTTDENWTTVYDMASEDAAINLGYTSGITGSKGVIADIPDLLNYSKIKFFATYNLVHREFEFDISDKSAANYFYMTCTNSNFVSFFNFTVWFGLRSGKISLNFQKYMQLDLYYNKYPVWTNLSANSKYFISKILVK